VHYVHKSPPKEKKRKREDRLTGTIVMYAFHSGAAIASNIGKKRKGEKTVLFLGRASS